MLIRFATLKVDSETHQEEGLFTAAYSLRDEGHPPDYELEQLKDLLRWFRDNLEAPDRFTRSTRPHSPGKAICWIKDSALEHIEKLWGIVTILENNGIQTRIIKTERPGYIVYEDEFQVAAEPFKEGTY
jgi:hypothetical protein